MSERRGHLRAAALEAKREADAKAQEARRVVVASSQEHYSRAFAGCFLVKVPPERFVPSISADISTLPADIVSPMLVTVDGIDFVCTHDYKGNRRWETTFHVCGQEVWNLRTLGDVLSRPSVKVKRGWRRLTNTLGATDSLDPPIPSESGPSANAARPSVSGTEGDAS